MTIGSSLAFRWPPGRALPEPLGLRTAAPAALPILVVLVLALVLVTLVAAVAPGVARASLVAAPGAQLTGPAAVAEDPADGSTDQGVGEAVPTEGDAPAVRHVVIVGVPGLRWDQVNSVVTPTIWAGAESAGIGLVSVRAARSLTCPADGWLTLSAGNRARGPSIAGSSCQTYFPYITPVQNSSGGAVIPEMGLIVEDNSNLHHGAVPGLLAASLRCVTGVAPGGALAAADTRGVVDVYRPALPADDEAVAALLGVCPVTIVAAEQLVSVPPGVNDALADIDGLVARVDAARPADSALLVVGVSEVGREGQSLHLLSARGPSFDPESWLVSPSTRRTPYAQLIDIAPTALGLLGVVKPSAMSGQDLASDQQRERPLEDDQLWMVDQDLMNRTHYHTVDFWWGALTGLVVLFFVVAGALMLAARRLEREGRGTEALRVRRGLQITGLSVAAVQLATFLGQLLPWWRQIIPAGFYATWVTIWVVPVVALALLIPWRRGPLRRYVVLGPAGVIAVLSALVLGYDVMAGAYLEFGSINGYDAIVAGRFVGFANTAFALYATGLLLGLGILTHRWSRWPAVLVISIVGLAGTAVVANPAWGNNFGGTITMFASVGLLILLNLEIRLSLWKVLVVLGAAGLAALGVMYLDYLRPPEERSHFGRFFEDLLSGEAFDVVMRKLTNNINLLLNSPLTLTLPAVAVFAWFFLRRRFSGVPQALRESPRLRYAVVTVAFCALIGSLVNDSSVAIAAVVIATLVPLLVAIGMRQVDPAWGRSSPADDDTSAQAAELAEAVPEAATAGREPS